MALNFTTNILADTQIGLMFSNSQIPFLFNTFLIFIYYFYYLQFK